LTTLRSQLHTACFAKNVVRVLYPYHPLYGHEVEIIQRKRYGDEVYFLVKLFDNTQVFLPAWMTDEMACHRCVVRDAPICSVTALVQLRQFLDTVA
jgi:hypothetical protein